MRASEPPQALRWLRERPFTFALVMAAVMTVVGVICWGNDLRPTIAGALLSALITYLMWRPGGFGWHLEAHQQRLLEDRGDLGVRPAFQAGAVVVLAALAVLLAVSLAAVLAS